MAARHPAMSTARGVVGLRPPPRGLSAVQAPPSSATGVSGAPLPPSPHHPFESSISSPDLPRVTDRNGRVLSKMPGAGGQDNKVCFVSKQEGKGSPLPPALASVPLGGCNGSVLRSGAASCPQRPLCLQTQSEGLRAQRKSGHPRRGASARAGSKACWPEGAELPFHSSSRTTTLSTKAKLPPWTRKAPRLGRTTLASPMTTTPLPD